MQVKAIMRRGRRLSLSALCLVLLLAAAATAPRAELLTTTEILAVPMRVWSVLVDTGAYPDWNPMIAGLRGRLVAGGRVELILGRGENRMVLWPRILAARPGAELRWRGRLWGIPGLFTAEHYFLLQPTARGTRLIQGERLRGILLWIFDAATLLPQFAATNEALARVATDGTRR